MRLPPIRWKKRSLRQFVSIDDEREEARPALAMSPGLDTAIVREAQLQSGLRLEHLRPDRSQPSQDECNVTTLELVARLRLAAESGRGVEMESLLPPEIQMLGDRDDRREPHEQGNEALQSAADELDELLSRQNCDGGWSAKQSRTAERDPDVTGAVLEALSLNGVAPGMLRRGARWSFCVRRSGVMEAGRARRECGWFMALRMRYGV